MTRQPRRDLRGPGVSCPAPRHKLRRAMVAPEREKLRGVVEMDETWVGGLQTGLKGSRQLKGR